MNNQIDLPTVLGDISAQINLPEIDLDAVGYSKDLDCINQIESIIPVSCSQPSTKQFHESEKHKCPKCFKEFWHKKHLNNHLLKHQIDNRDLKVKCSNCETKFNSRKQLINHLNKEHDESIEINTVQLEDKNAFNDFKIKLEEETTSRFIKVRGQNMNNRMYECNRSGSAVLKSEDERVNDESFKGSCKTGQLCTAYIKCTVITGGKCSVEYCSSHYGHRNEAKFLRLDDSTISKIISMGRLKIDIREIYRQIRCDFKEKNVKAKNLISVDQVRYHLKKISTELSTDDLTNLQLLYERESMYSRESRFIQFYKKRNSTCDQYPDLDIKVLFMVLMNKFQMEIIKSFSDQNERVVCMDATHGLNNKKVQLITLLIIDEYGNGMPVAFCLCEKEDQVTIEAFLKIVISLAGHIEAEYFLSDDASQYFNGWNNVMGQSKKILCAWHVFRAFKQKLKEKVKDDEQQNEIMKRLMMIRDSSDVESAVISLDKLIDELFKKKSTKDFGQYLKSHYRKRMDQWVYGYRTALIPNCNMHIESLHHLIKVIFLSCKRIHKISACIQVLREVIEQKMVDRLVKMTDRKNDKKTREIFDIHQEAINEMNKYEMNLFAIDDENGDHLYEVISPNNKKYWPVLKKLENHSCEFSCRKCTICRHYMTCTCPYYKVHRNMCKHIHMIAIEYETVCVNMINEAPLPELDQFDRPEIQEVIIDQVNSAKQDEVRKMVADIKFILEKVSQVVQEAEIENNLDELTNIRNSCRNMMKFIKLDNSGPEEPKTKKRKITHQRR